MCSLPVNILYSPGDISFIVTQICVAPVDEPVAACAVRAVATSTCVLRHSPHPAGPRQLSHDAALVSLVHPESHRCLQQITEGGGAYIICRFDNNLLVTLHMSSSSLKYLLPDNHIFYIRMAAINVNTFFF